MKKILAIVLMMALAAMLACTAFASGEPSAAPAAPAAEEAGSGGTFQYVFKEPTATENGWIFEIDAATGNVVNVIYTEPTGAVDNFAAWKEYVKAYALAGAPNEEEGQTVAGLIDAAASVEDVAAIPQLTVLFEAVGVMEFDAWVAAGMPAADTEGMGSQADASGEASEEAPASEEPAASAEPAAPASEEAPSAEPAAPASEEAAAETAAETPANPNYDPAAHNWASIELIMAIVIVVVGAILMLSFGKKKVD